MRLAIVSRNWHLKFSAETSSPLNGCMQAPSPAVSSHQQRTHKLAIITVISKESNNSDIELYYTPFAFR